MNKYILPLRVDYDALETAGVTKSMGWLLALDLCAMFTKGRFPLLISRVRQVIDAPTKAVKRNYFHLSTPEGMLVIRIKECFATEKFYVTTEATEVKERGAQRATLESGTLVGMTRAVKKAMPRIIGNTNVLFTDLLSQAADSGRSDLYASIRGGDTLGYHKIYTSELAELVKAFDKGDPNAPMPLNIEEVLKDVRKSIANEAIYNKRVEEFFQPTKWVVRYNSNPGSLLSIGAVKMDSGGAIKEVVMPFKAYRSVEEFCGAHPESENDLIVGLKGVISNCKMSGNGNSTMLSMTPDDAIVLPIPSIHTVYFREANQPFGYAIYSRKMSTYDNSRFAAIIIDKVM